MDPLPPEFRDKRESTLVAFGLVALAVIGFGLVACLPFYVLHRIATILGL